MESVRCKKKMKDKCKQTIAIKIIVIIINNDGDDCWG